MLLYKKLLLMTFGTALVEWQNPIVGISGLRSGTVDRPSLFQDVTWPTSLHVYRRFGTAYRFRTCIASASEMGQIEFPENSENFYECIPQNSIW